MTSPPEYWYRIEELPSYQLYLAQVPVLRHTPKGLWLLTPHGPKFTLLDATKQYAKPTPALAYESYLARRRRNVRILKVQLEHAENFLALAEHAGEAAFSSPDVLVKWEQVFGSRYEILLPKILNSPTRRD